MDTIYDAKLLIVDDNAELLALLCEQLRGAGYGHIRTAQSCAAARACFAAEQPELMILDINLPDGDGFSLFRALRAKADVPALFLSARDADADRLFGLGLGADDYLTKPFLMQELLLRVQHILQRAYRAELSRTKPAPLQLGERCVDLNDAIVTLPEGKTLTLTATELALLRKLAENRGHIVTYDALCAAVWGADYYGYENSLGVHIRHLREKLEAEPGAPQFLRTVLGWLGWQEGCRLPQREYSSSEIADSMVETAEGLAFGAERTPQEWMNGYEWAMVLDDVGNIRWSYGLPQELNHAYTPGDIAKFSRWYLADYPVFCWTEPYGLFVIGLPKGSLWKYSIYSSPDFALSMVRVLPAAALGLLMLGLVLCFWLSWRGAKRLETVANGLEALAQGQTVQLPTDGFAGELAEKLNQTGAQLQAKNEMLSRRDNARTQWIAGVSHDVRTPLALILGWAEQLEQDALLPDSSRQKAAGIRTQCEKLRALIDDLNLTSKLEYGAQPLRRKDLRAGPLFRQLVAQFCESPLAEHCGITLEQEEPAEQTVLSVDEALMARLLENLLNNSVRHNPKPVNITVHTRRAGERFCLTVADDGIGYPPAVLAALNAAEPAENAPHILGLYVVQQIAAAHGGRAVFGQNTPHGAKAVVYLPLG